MSNLPNKQIGDRFSQISWNSSAQKSHLKTSTNGEATKLNKANAMLLKIRHDVDITTLKPVCQTYLSYCLLVWVQNS